VGFNAFLYERKVPTITTPGCGCGHNQMTVEHVLLRCPTSADKREEVLGPLQQGGLKDLLTTREGCYQAARFVLRTDLLEQFRGSGGEISFVSFIVSPQTYIRRHRGVH
jgi:hypothetical protein